jgi:hypothetical protein
MDWQEGNTALKGGFEDREGEVKHGKTKGDKYIYQTWVSPRIIGAKMCSITGEKWVTETMWLPPSKELKVGRWAKFVEGDLNEWMPLPEPK